MKTRLNCPCGLKLEEADEDSLVNAALSHLHEAHPGMDYHREHILFMAY